MSVGEHTRTIRNLIRFMHSQKLQANLEKCTFGAQSIITLGHHVEYDCLYPTAQHSFEVCEAGNCGVIATSDFRPGI